MAREPLKCRSFFPDENGGYKSAEKLTPEEKKAWAEKAAGRMGRTLNDWFSQNRKEYVKI